MFSPFRIFVVLGITFVVVLVVGLATIQKETPALPEIVLTPVAEAPQDEEKLIEEPEDKRLEADPPEEPAEQEKSIGEAVGTIAKTLTTPPPVLLSPLSLNERVRASLVNILCTTKTSGPLHSITGSGVFIDPRGVLLTNAHVAQYFLLKDYPSPDFFSCVIRTGSPAYPTYRARLLYLPPSWIRANAEKIDDDTPIGNGEHDYALLLVNEVIDEGAPLPNPFPYLPLLYSEVNEGDDVLVAGYPAGFLGGITVAKELYAASAPARIGELFTYASTTVDIFSVGGSIVAQQGSSGGAVVDTNGNLVGLIVTSTITGETSTRDLHAVATSYIARDFENERGIPLPTLFSYNLEEQSTLFTNTTAPQLLVELIKVLAQ